MDLNEQMMRLAIRQAVIAKEHGDVAVGAVIARGADVIAAGYNQTEALKDPTLHAEIVAIRAAARAMGTWRLSGLSLYVTLEPCPMCAGAILAARLEKLVFGAYDPSCGCAGSVYRITEDPAFSHFTIANGGILRVECERLLRETWRV